MKGLLRNAVWVGTTLFLFTACSTDKYNVSDLNKIEDVNKNNTYVYGEGPDAPPRQLGNDPEDTKEAEEASKRIYDKFFVEPYKAVGTEDSTATDSTAAKPVETTADSTKAAA